MVEPNDRPTAEPSVAELREQLAEVEAEIQEVRREVVHRAGPTLAEGPARGSED